MKQLGQGQFLSGAGALGVLVGNWLQNRFRPKRPPVADNSVRPGSGSARPEGAFAPRLCRRADGISEPNLSQAVEWRGKGSEGKAANVGPLAEVVRRMEGLKHAAAAQAVRRLAERQAGDPDMRRFVANPRRQLEMAMEGRSFETPMSIVWI